MMPIEPFNVPLTREVSETYERNGLVTVPRLTTDEEATWLRGVYDRLLADRLRAHLPSGGERGSLNTLWLRLNRWEEVVLRHTTIVQNGQKLAAELLGVPLGDLHIGLRFFFKPARGGGPVPWHQDEAHYDPRYDHRSLNAWIPLDDVNPTNGCLWYIPGSHQGGVRVHRHPGGRAPEVALMTDDVRENEAVAVQLRAGGASFHHCRTLHCSRSNSTEGHRRALVLVCAGPRTLRDRPNERPWLTESHAVPETSF
jgi:ectoine hydroxylase-related dioxygenase (phytanoyl-CoA dioxygenase family)